MNNVVGNTFFAEKSQVIGDDAGRQDGKDY